MGQVSVPNLGPDPFTVNASVLNGKVDPLVTDYNSNIDDSNIAVGANIANAKLNLTSISQAVTMTGGLTVSTTALTMSAMPINEAKGADIASAGTNTTNITTATGNTVHITGTTTITGFVTATAGIRRILIFDGILTFTHNSTSLILPTGANITTAAGDTAIMVSEGSGNWRCINYARKDGTSLVAFTPSTSNALSKSTIQTVITKSSAVATSSGTAVDDDTAPQLSECPVITALNTAITASNASNTLIITATLNVQLGATTTCVAALFLDSATDASAAIRFSNTETARPFTVTLVFSVSPADTSAHTYKIGIGGVSATVVTINGSGGNRLLGGTLYSTVRIDEIKA